MQPSPPARANQQQRELVRLLYLEHGHQKASELSQVPYATVRQWAHRYGWSQPREKALSQSVTRLVADKVQESLEEDERETRASLSRASRRMAKDCEELPVRHAALANTVAKTMAIVHRQGDQAQQGFSLNVLNLGQLQIGIQSDSTDNASA